VVCSDEQRQDYLTDALLDGIAEAGFKWHILGFTIIGINNLSAAVEHCQSLLQKSLAHAEHEILIFLYLKIFEFVPYSLLEWGFLQWSLVRDHLALKRQC
jgi:hypothetical protein